jgi:hypothetical protein
MSRALREERAGVRVALRKLREIRAREYMIRFGFGATISIVAGLVGLRFGQAVGGVFLAFPAILPASLTLIARKESEQHASINAEGAVIGGLALVVFAVVAFALLPRLGLVALVVATAAWGAAALALYFAARAWLRIRHEVPRPA